MKSRMAAVWHICTTSKWDPISAMCGDFFEQNSPSPNLRRMWGQHFPKGAWGHVVMRPWRHPAEWSDMSAPGTNFFPKNFNVV